MTINEDGYIKRRPVENVVVDRLEKQQISTYKTKDYLICYFGLYKLKIHFESMLFELMEGNRIIFQMNKHNRLNYDPLPQESFTSSPGPRAVAMEFSFLNTKAVYGLPERSSSFRLPMTQGDNIKRNESIRLYNLDVNEYESHSVFPLYGSIPLIIGMPEERRIENGRELWNRNGVYTGVLWLNAANTYVDLREEDATEALSKNESNDNACAGHQIHSHFISETGQIDFFVFASRTIRGLLSSYHLVTGQPALPALFSLGYHQSKWDYNGTEDCLKVLERLDESGVPCDVIWLDIEHTNGKRYFTWKLDAYPDPVGFQTKVAEQGRKIVAIVDPHVKKDEGYHVYQQAKEKGHLIRTRCEPYSRGKRKESLGEDKSWSPRECGVFEGSCWPGHSVYPDFMSPEVRKWWAGLMHPTQYREATPVMHTWIDMNEPTVFNGHELTLPRDALHLDGREHREVHNVFGDNQADWDHLQGTTGMLLSMNLCGYGFVGADVGGFFFNPSEELLTRWYQMAALQPFFREHAHADAKRREPYLFREPYNKLMGDAVRLRYRLLPYIYRTMMEHTVSGVPPMRPLWMDYGFLDMDKDEESSTANSNLCASFALGSDLVVVPVVNPGATEVKFTLPRWRKKEEVEFVKTEEERVAIMEMNISEAEKEEKLREWKDQIDNRYEKVLWYELESGQLFDLEAENSEANGSSSDSESQSNTTILNDNDTTLEAISNDDSFEAIPDMHKAPRFSLAVSISSLPVFQRGGSILPEWNRKRRSTFHMLEDPITLVAAPDVNGEASGTIFIDDGRTHAWELIGQYGHRKVTMKVEEQDRELACDEAKETNEKLVRKRIILTMREEPLPFGLSATKNRTQQFKAEVHKPPTNCSLMHEPAPENYLNLSTSPDIEKMKEEILARYRKESERFVNKTKLGVKGDYESSCEIKPFAPRNDFPRTALYTVPSVVSESWRTIAQRSLVSDVVVLGQRERPVRAVFVEVDEEGQRKEKSVQEMRWELAEDRRVLKVHLPREARTLFDWDLILEYE
ncbi:putative alpha 1,3-glucosidase [Monocercomonoides exilis]|uniref:putative alpha 1,3-glucosidase n=1 Tax=Monocercomonoides exilis TaxID=2049356 RepID=UPI00355A4556|nr:putative alpha 1,3-glucosidase [Monocercomonoides exilis]|eukprot:MONOS_4748.1-p1 / transcript=MONOS_4748.1 / gene=MONOS_4748 / organism=Monocercomonoides_exilis_PA203 / gene_product=alpha 1,3-glucosidase / transcript_product=alpha 1,3-glucosidase / location=Mono_scaffold00130:69784-73455(+) / protein_length=1028 / sequence_SO=supercontig / SO=protein_coding / is_pseudo=false